MQALQNARDYVSAHSQEISGAREYSASLLVTIFYGQQAQTIGTDAGPLICRCEKKVPSDERLGYVRGGTNDGIFFSR